MYWAGDLRVRLAPWVFGGASGSMKGVSLAGGI